MFSYCFRIQQFPLRGVPENFSNPSDKEATIHQRRAGLFFEKPRVVAFPRNFGATREPPAAFPNGKSGHFRLLSRPSLARFVSPSARPPSTLYQLTQFFVFSPSLSLSLLFFLFFFIGASNRPGFPAISPLKCRRERRFYL